MNPRDAQNLIQKTKDDYNRIAPQFDSTRKYNWRDIATVIDNLGIKKGSKVLDLGCGGGRLYEILEKYKIDYTGVDISEKLIKTAGSKYPKAKFFVGDITGFETKDKFDYVFSIAALHHIPSKKLRDRSIKNIKDALNSDGTAIISVWYFWNQSKYVKEIAKQFLKITNLRLPWGDLYIPWKNQRGEVLAQRYHHAWTARELKKYGFKIVSKNRNLIALFKNPN
jgi:SAM-dependent methyltransferase